MPLALLTGRGHRPHGLRRLARTLRLACSPAARRAGQGGQVIVLFAIFLTLIIAFAGIVIDLGVLRNDRQLLVNAVDAAALAGGTLMPVDGSATATPAGQFATANALIADTLDANYPGGVSASQYTITYHCLIGVVGNAPAVARDVPGVCNPANALGHAPVAADFLGAGSTRTAPCRPDLGDRCNTVVVTASANQDFTFGRVVGVDSGSTGAVMAASCKGPCGNPLAVPVDVVLIMDRTASMSATDIASIQSGADTVLSVFNPALQRIALGTIGPSKPGLNACPSGSTSPLRSKASPANQVYGVGQSSSSNVNFFAYPTDLTKWIPVGFSSTDTAAPSVTFNESYSASGLTNTSSTIWKSISCLYSYTTGTNLDTPILMAQRYLETYGRPGVKKGIILETDGTPQAGDGSAHYTCNAANNTATAAKASASKIEIYTIGFGISDAHGNPTAFCPTRSGGGNRNANESAAWSGRPASALLASMATDSSHYFNAPTSAELAAAFQTVAVNLASGGAHLVDLYPPPLVATVSPGSGTHIGGATVTVSGQYFTGATSVSFGGTASSFTVVSDTQITATAPPGPAGATVDVRVTTAAGTSPVVAGDSYTYN